jgi:hypothetical protein
MSHPDDTVEVVETFPAGGFNVGNRFKQWVLPALREVMAGKAQEELDVPNLYDGWRVQLFTDAALESSRRGSWVEVEK